jgi:TonB family protein
MAESYRSFGSFILFKEVLADELGHFFRAAEFDQSGVKRTVWLRVLDAPGVPAAEVAAQADTANRVGEILQAANVAVGQRLVVEGAVPALSFNFVSGQPLSLVLTKARAEGFPVPVDNALLILEKLSLGLSAALGVEIAGTRLVHGFLHPSLVVVSHDGEGVVAGFGVADRLLALLDGPQADAIRPYLAPEVIITRTPSRRGDVYSLGAILFELLTGERLPDQPEARSVALDQAQMAYDEQPIPPDIKALLQRALAPRPEERFGSAVDFKKELDKLLYGGAYSPTTFNLALFMDRLFRSEVETEERERGVEAKVSVEPYLAQPEPAPVPVPAPAEREFEFSAPPAAEGSGKGMWVGIAAGIVIIGVIAAFLFLRGGTSTPAVPTPTPQDVQAKINEAVQQELARLMADKEKEIAAELTKRQGKIDELQKKLGALQPSAAGGTETADARRSREALERQLADEKAAKQQQEKNLEEDRLQALQKAKEKAIAVAAAQQQAAPAAAVAIPPTPPPAAAATGRPAAPAVEPTEVVALEPTAAPGPDASRPPLPAVTTVTENMFLDPSQVDTMPATLKEAEVVWSRAALYSRRRGVVIMQATVNSSGRVEDVKVLRTDHDGFGIPEAAKEAVQKYVFKPATKNGISVKTHATVTIRYVFQTR